MSTLTWIHTELFRNSAELSERGILLSNSWQIRSLKSDESDDVILNIVLAYLNSFRPSDKSELTQRLQCLTRKQEVNENIKNSVEIFNPFLDCNACFSDTKKLEIVATFKDKVEDYIKEKEIQFQAQPKNFRYLEASSILLSCYIVLISYQVHRKIVVTVFPVEPDPNTNYPNHILILDEFTRKTGISQEKFSFCIPEEIGKPKKIQALTTILKQTRMIGNDEKMIQEISRLPDITEMFLISLLENGFRKVIPFIYESPYVLSKLADAGFETDPRMIDSTGKSAFFYALQTEESQLVFLLYDHVANTCLQTDASVRSPDPVIVENLLCLKDYLKLMEKDLKSKETSEKSRCLFRCLCRFNEFQSEMCTQIYKVRDKINPLDHTEKECDFLQRIETMLIILEIYGHFDSIKGESFVGLKDFYVHKDYFDKLDFSSVRLFLDNLFLLKGRLLLPDKTYLNIESTFSLFIYCRDYLKRYEKEKYYSLFTRWVTFQERLLLQRQMFSFKEILEKPELLKDKLRETEIRTLTNFPDIYGQSLLLRMQHYLNAATRAQFSQKEALVPSKITTTAVKDLKSILVIERCLQVIGECYKVSDFTSVQNIISLALPKNSSTYLKRIRVCLSHINSYKLFNRNALEKEVNLFKEIQKDLAELTKFLLQIYSAHKYEVDKCLLLRFKETVDKARRCSISEGQENQLMDIIPSPEMEENQLSMQKSHCKNQKWKCYFDDMFTFLSKEIDNLNLNANILDKNTSSCYKKILQNLILSARKLLKDEKAGVTEMTVEELESRFLCLENILTYIATDRNLAKYKEELTWMLKERKSLFTELVENSKLFQKINKSTNTVIDGTPIGKDDIVGKKLSLEPEDTHDNSQQPENPIDVYEMYGVVFDKEPSNFTCLNEYEDNKSSHEKAQSSETNQIENEINLGNFDSSILQNMSDGINNILQESTDAKECEKSSSDLQENVKDPEKIFQNTETDSAFNVSNDYPVHIASECLRKMLDVTARFLDGYEKIANSIFEKFRNDSKEDEIDDEKVDFKNIEKFFLILKGRAGLKNEEKELILQSVPEQYQDVPGLKQKAKALLKRETEFTEELRVVLAKLELKNRDIKEIKRNIKHRLNYESDLIVDSARDYYSELMKVVDLKEIDKFKYESLCKKLELPDDAKNILLKLVSGQNKAPNNEFEFLRNRIKLLKNILINENHDIQQLWEVDTNSRRKMHLKEKIIHLYLKDSEIQASIEMLLLDCMTILSSTKLQKHWEKTTHFNCINLRNVLVHGHPLLESSGSLLDPYDLTTALVEMMLQLISDEYVLDCMQQIVEQSGTNFSCFMQIINDEENQQFKEIIEVILNCDHWKKYALLIPFH